MNLERKKLLVGRAHASSAIEGIGMSIEDIDSVGKTGELELMISGLLMLNTSQNQWT